MPSNFAFNAFFTFQLIHTTTRADGIVFVIQGTTNTAGGTGQDLGFTGINPGFGIEFDTYKNTVYADPDNNHVAIITNGSAHHGTGGNPAAVSISPSTIDLADGTLHYCWIDYDGTTVKVRLSNTNNRSTASVVLSQTFDIAALFSGNTDIYYGFTASTGGESEEQDVSSYYFNNDNSLGGIDTSLNSYTSGPYTITPTVSPAYVATNGTSHISALVKDLSDNPMPGETITFSSTSGTLSTTTAVTNASGYAYADLTGSGAPATATVRASAACGTYGVATVYFENPTKVQIETAANGSGTVVAAQSLASGSAITVYAISHDASGNFVANVSGTWSLGSIVGGVVTGDLSTTTGTSTVFTGHIIGSANINIVSGALTPTNSGTITVNAGPATKVAVETAANGSGTVVAAQSLASGSAITVYAISRDASGNFVANVSGTWSLGSIVGGVVTGDLSTTTGTSTVFTGHIIGSANINIVSGALTPTNSGTITVNAGAAKKLAMKTEPSATATAGAAFATQPAVYVEDTFGNIVTTDTSTIAVALATGFGPLQGTASISALAGVATFTNLADNKAESITLRFTDGALTGVIDTTTIVISAGTLDHFTINTPTGQINYGTFPITITAQDGYGNTITTYSGTNTLTDSTGSILPATTGSFVSGTWTGNITITTAPNGDIISTTGEENPGLAVYYLQLRLLQLRRLYR
jgi:large repetitive protein